MTLEVKHSVVTQTAPGTKPVTTCDTAKSDKAPRATLPLILTCDVPTTPRRSPKKTGRILVEKGVGTAGSKRERKPLVSRETPTTTINEKTETVPDKATAPSPGLLLAKKIRKFMTSSQVSSYYEGDDEFFDLLKQVEEHEGTKTGLLPHALVETFPPTVSTADSSSSNSSPLSSNPTTSSGSIPTSAEHRRRKRAESPSDCPRTKPRRETPPQPREKPQTDVSRKETPQKAVTVEASHSRKTKQDKPIPRCMLPGHSAPVAATSVVAVDTSGVIQTRLESTGSRVGAVVRAEAVEIVEIKDDDMEIVEISTPKKSASAVTERQTKTKESRLNAGPKTPVKSLSATDEPRVVTIVAHDERKQRLLDDDGIEKGVQYEIARGITQKWWTWQDITVGVVEQLRGTNFEKAGKVGEIIGKYKEHLSPAVIATRQAIYAELDREREAFVENKGRGLGLMGGWKHKENWYGGCVQFTAKVESNKDGQPPIIRLNSFGIGKSHRGARLSTSLSILQVKYDDVFDDKREKKLVELLRKPLIICGRQYVPFCKKDNKVFFVETKGEFERKPIRSFGDHYKMSFRKFVRTINPMDLNSGQAMSKWLARWQLILSTTRPVIEFQHENIFLGLEDIYGGDSTADRKAESIMTDGCGFVNLSALRLIATNTGSVCPVVVQGRIAGAKGLWILHPDREHRIDGEPPKLWIRDSQLKIRFGPKETWNRDRRIFDLVRLPRLTVPSGLNYQTILNMSYNGVKDEVFEDLMEEGLKREIEALTKWDGDNVCVTLARAVEEAGNIMASRRSRGAGGDARLYSYTHDEEDESEESKITSGGLVERDPISGCPLTLYESTREMLLAGFNPIQSSLLREKLKNVLAQTIKSYQDNYHVPVPRSAEAFIAPDPYGVLKEGEIFFRCSIPIGDPKVSIDPHTFLGPVLVSRNPTRVASDVRKVTAVHHDKLLSYTDVIIFSVKGERSLASYLGGGDYDGDTVTVFAEPTLVDAFTNSDYVPEPPEVRAAFQEEVEKVSAFLDRVKGMGSEEIRAEITEKILTSLSDGRVGLYSNMHENCVYSTGYNSKESIRLAYMFTTYLDSNKSGLRIKPNVIIEDRKRWDAPRPECMQKSDDIARSQFIPAARSPLVRPRSLGRFVLESLRKCAKDLSDNALISYEKLCDEAERNSSCRDSDLSRPYEEMKDYVKRLQENYGITRPADDLRTIEEFVAKLCNEYVLKFGSELGSRSPQKSPSKGKTVKARPIAQITNEFARRFEEELPDDSLEAPAALVKEVKASYAHIYGSSKSKLARGFAFAVAHDTVCAIKVRARGGSSTIRECRDFTLVSRALVKVLHTDQG